MIKKSGGFLHAMDEEGNIKLKQGHTFYTVHDFINVLKVFAMKNGFKLKRIKNEKAMVTCKCAAANCTWRIHASPTWDKLCFQIKTYNPTHSCGRVFNNYKANSAWIATKFLHLFRANPNLDIKVIASELLRMYKVICPPLRLYRARRKALGLLRADHKALYSKLGRYVAAITHTNPSSTADSQTEWKLGDEKPTFKRFFVYFDAQRRGFFDRCR